MNNPKFLRKLFGKKEKEKIKKVKVLEKEENTCMCKKNDICTMSNTKCWGCEEEVEND